MLTIFVAIMALFAVFIVTPLFSKTWKKASITTDSDRENLLYKKEEILASLNDLEYDLKMKKVTEPDYLQLKASLKREAIEVMKKLEPADGAAKEHAASTPNKRSRNHDKARV
jgi:hypothetical protein